MLVPGSEVLEWAMDQGVAAASFNTYDLSSTRAIIAAAEAESRPIFLAVGTGPLREGDPAALMALVVAAARSATVPVAVHLDHGDDVTEAVRCVEAGFSSVMVDGSPRPYADNVLLVRTARRYLTGVTLEAELGGIGGAEDRSAATDDRGAELTDPGQAAAFVAETGVDSLAVAIGNAHGRYRGAPRLDLDRLAVLERAVAVPLVLHGASGLPDDVLRACITRGIRKFNVNTELRRVTLAALRAELAARPPDDDDVLTLARAPVAAMTAAARRLIRLFAGGSG